MIAARGSIPFLIGAVLCRQADFKSDPYFIHFLRPELLADEKVANLAKKVELRVDPEFDYNLELAPPADDVNGYIKLEGRVTLRLRDGRTLVGYDDVFASTGNMTWKQVADKFRAVTDGVIAPATADAIVEVAMSLGNRGSVRELVALVA